MRARNTESLFYKRHGQLDEEYRQLCPALTWTGAFSSQAFPKGHCDIFKRKMAPWEVLSNYAGHTKRDGNVAHRYRQANFHNIMVGVSGNAHSLHTSMCLNHHNRKTMGGEKERKNESRVEMITAAPYKMEVSEAAQRSADVDDRWGVFLSNEKSTTRTIHVTEWLMAQNEMECVHFQVAMGKKWTP